MGLRSDHASILSKGRSRRTRRGQSLVEFALVLPVLLAITGVVIDASRVYFQWVDLESATRDAAQYIASDPGLIVSGGTYLSGGGYYDPNDTANYCGVDPWTTCTVAPARDAKAVVDRETKRTFAASSTQTEAACSAHPTVWAVLQHPDTSKAVGGNASYPVATVRVTACLAFRTLFSYPFISTDGAWMLRTDRTFTTIVGR